MKILVVEDEYDLANIISEDLKEKGFDVDNTYDGEEALKFIDEYHYNLIILDLMLPKINGLEVLETIRNDNNMTPVIILTAKNKLEDKIKGLDLGADDYITKPFEFQELRARIRALLRRKNENLTKNIIIDNLIIDTISHKVKRDNDEIFLTTNEYSVLEYLARNKDKILTRDEIEEHVWDFRFGDTSNIVDVYIRYLRKKIDQEYRPKLIKTVRGKGYTLKEPEND